MIVDCHFHVCAFASDHGKTSLRVLNHPAFRFIHWKLGIAGADARTEQALAQAASRLIAHTPPLDAAVVLAFDAVHTREGQIDLRRTHLYVSNDYAMALARRYPQMLFGASVHPYRRDAVAEIERCVDAGAVLLKWLPIVQDFDPSDARCIPVYEALAHFRLPLLSHTGGERALPNLNRGVADPRLLEPALRRGVTVIAAHCGTRSAPGERDFVPEFSEMARRHEHFYGDTAALNLPARSHAWKFILNDAAVRRKLVHGSDWPIPVVPPIRMLGPRAIALFAQPNWLLRDVLIKQRLGLDYDYWHRAGTLLRRVP